ncbi:MAG: TraL conjugative transposon family protein [Prevotellaceae bacterium]|jgi:hypothetical protein|nr:TraL conjugative transposon family protein [Prevotellaceae bacterium]
MKELRKKRKEFLTNVLDEIEYRLKHLCGRPAPMKRFIIVLSISVALAAVNIYFVASSIYSIGKRDAEMEFLKLQYIEGLKLQPQLKNDSINILNQKEHEYE